MTWKGRKVLVTGAGGFIGSHLAERLVGEGARVRAFVHYNALGRAGWLDASPVATQMEIVAGDIADPWSVREAMRGIDVVFHLAALIAIPYSYQAPQSYLRTNAEGTLNILQAARDLGTTRVVHTSTSEVYGTARSVPIDEDHPLQGQSPYSASKIAADKLAESFHRSFALPVTTVRPFNTFGPRQSLRAVIPTIVTQLLDGETVKLGHLAPTRDLTYVSDTAGGFLAAGAAAGAEGQVFNLGAGREISIGDLARMIGALMGRTPRIETEDVRLRPEASEVERLLSDNRRMRGATGWTPLVGLEEGLQRTIDWIKANRDRYQRGAHVF